MKRSFQILGVALVVLLAIVVGRALMITPASKDANPLVEIPVDEAGIAGRMSEAIRFQTVSKQAPQAIDPLAFEGFIAWAARSYPEVHAQMATERVGTYSLLHTWTGSDPALAPILLTGHYDVVPVIPASLGDWNHPPFEGVIADGFVWGRGALDDKSAVITMYEAATLLLRQGFEPTRTIYFAFDHDEEIGGREGAVKVTELLRSRGVELEWSLDEGSFLISGLLPGIEAPIASINVAEKGYITLDVVTKGEGGHSSVPPAHTAVGELAKLIVKIEDNPMPGGVEGLMAEGLDAMAPHAPFAFRLILANRWLFDPLIEIALSGTRSANAMLGTTTAVTMVSGSVKENVLPIEAIASVNFRIHPRDSVDVVIAHLTSVIDDDSVEIRPRGFGSSPSKVSSTQSAGFRDIAAATLEVVGEAIVIPGLTLGGTDSRHFSQVATDSYRFNPMLISIDEVAGFHGTNERISIENLGTATRVYVRILQRAAGAPEPAM